MERNIYLKIPDVSYSPEGSTRFPISSTAFSILKTANIRAMAIQAVSITKCRPGHLLRPKPKTSIGSGTLGSSRPSPVRKRDGSKACVFGYRDSSCRIALPSIVNIGSRGDQYERTTSFQT